MSMQNIAPTRGEGISTPQTLPETLQPGKTSDPQYLNSYDRLTARIAQSRAMLVMTTGETGEAFRRLNPTIQSDFMWAIGDMLDDIDMCVRTLLLPNGGEA